MARFDTVGMFWDDTPPPKPPKKEKIIRTPPEPVWLRPDYLPGLEKARAMRLDLLSDQGLIEAWRARERLNYDIECYPNYILIAMRTLTSKKYLVFEIIVCEDGTIIDNLDRNKLAWVLANFTMVGFNIIKYDNVIATLAASGKRPLELWRATEQLIVNGMRPADVFKLAKVSKIKIDSIDLIEYTALRPSLKKCAGRMHAPRMQDLPYQPGTWLNIAQIDITRWYCVNDLDNTELLYRRYAERLALREQLTTKYNVDLRSSSDAQMAEHIIGAEVRRLTGQRHINKTKLAEGTCYQYQTPGFIKFQTDLLNWILRNVQNSIFQVDPKTGSLVLPEAIRGTVIEINGKHYKFGLGGLHSQEKAIGYVANEEYMIVDTDATSYYPYLILNAGLTPPSLGHNFLIVYNGIVVSRVAAKEAGDIITAEGLKITANGTFGKLGSPYSIVYAPNLLMQTTVTGQFSVLMFIELMELNGFEVMSANTDGIVCYVKRSRKAEFDALRVQWEKQTGFKTEETLYRAVYSRDVNNYVAIYETPQKKKLFKGKGIFNSRHPDKSDDASSVDLKKNPANEICANAALELMLRGTPIEQSIHGCRDITKFTTMREVKGGGVHNGIYLGKIVRWYHAIGDQPEIVYAKSGNKVADSDGSKPCMELPTEFPNDIDYAWYIDETKRTLINMGFMSGEVTVSPDEDLNDEGE